MATIDSVFTKSNLEESKKKAKMLLGRLLISLRKNNHMKLYSLFESVEESDIIDNCLVVTMSDKFDCEMINNQGDLEQLKECLNDIESGLNVKVVFNGKEAFSIEKFESKLKDEFGKLLTIKK